MTYQTLIVERADGFAVVTLNRPPANAISEALIRELNAALSGFEADDAVRSVIITGAGDRIFIGPNAALSPMYERMVKRVAMQREGAPEDVAPAVAFLVSERARYITGAVLTATGGMDLFAF